MKHVNFTVNIGKYEISHTAGDDRLFIAGDYLSDFVVVESGKIVTEFPVPGYVGREILRLYDILENVIYDKDNCKFYKSNNLITDKRVIKRLKNLAKKGIKDE